MSPGRRTPYRPPRDRRELITAISVVGALIVFTVVMVWVLGPHSSGSSTPSTPPITAPPPTTVPKRHATSTTTTRPRSSSSTSTSTLGR